jgi:hypothetical protein
MEYEKNIEEMAEVIESELKVYFGAGDVVAPEDFPYQARGIAESLAKKGYRKESDTAREIIEWIKRNGTLGYGGYVIHDSTIEQICKKYSVDLVE